MDQLTQKGIVLALATAVISGVSIFLNAFAVTGFDAAVFTFAKNVSVAVALLVLLFAVGSLSRLRTLTRKDWFSLVGIGLVGGSLPFVLFFRGLQMTSGTLASFLHKCLFVVVAFLAVFFLKEKIRTWYAVGAILLLAGMGFLLRPSLDFGSGHVLILAAVLFWSVEQVWSKAVVARLGGTLVACGRMLFGSVALFCYLALTERAGTVFSLTLLQYLWILFTSVLLFLYVLTYYQALVFIPVSSAAAILTLGSPLTLMLQWLFLDLSLSVVQVLGMAFVCAGIGFVLFSLQGTPSRFQKQAQTPVCQGAP